MKFIFPQNYHFQNKLFGIFDYHTIILNVIWCAFILLIVVNFLHNINAQIFVFIFTCFPLFLFSIYGINGENILYIFSYMFKFILKQKLFLYFKE